MTVLLIVFFAGVVVFHLLEHVAPVREGYEAGVTRRGYLADCIATFVNGPALSGLTKIAAIYLALLVPPQASVMGGWPWWVQFGVYFLVNDLGRYWLHRWYHASPLLWRIHRVHHTVVEMDSMSVFRMHVLEAVLKNGLLLLPFRVIGVAESVIIAYSAWDILKGFWHHANLRTYIGPLNYVFNSAELHWWHHSIELRGQMANYGSILSVWDWLFGTAYWPKGEWPKEIGVAGMERFPDSYLGQLTSIRYDDREIIEGRMESNQEQAGGLPLAASHRGEILPGKG